MIMNKRRNNYLARVLMVMISVASAADYQGIVPLEKDIPESWLEDLKVRGEKASFRGDELTYVGMPIGGIAAGHVYLGGDGRLWNWDIFNQYRLTRIRHYQYPVLPESPFEMTAQLWLTQGHTEREVTLDRDGLSEVTFTGTYPSADINYTDTALG